MGYTIGKNYKFFLPEKIVYTGKILSKTKEELTVETIHGEIVILNRITIIQGKELNEGVKDGKDREN